MYLPQHFAVDDLDEVAALVHRVAAADLVTVGADGTPVSTVVPVLWDRSDADPAAALASTLDASRGATGGELRAHRPKGLARAAREARRVIEQTSRWLRLSPTMSKRRIPFA